MWRKGPYREWTSGTLIVVSLSHRDTYKVMQRALRPDQVETSTVTQPPPLFSDTSTGSTKINRQVRRRKNGWQNLYILLHLMTAGSAKLLGRTHEGESGGPGNGQAAWQALEERDGCCTKKTRRESYETLINLCMELGQDPDAFFIILDKRRAAQCPHLVYLHCCACATLLRGLNSLF